MPGTVMLPALVGVARTLQFLGVPEDAIVSTIGRPLDVRDPDVRVPSDRLLALYDLALEVTGRRDVPIVIARSMGVEHLGVMGFAIVTAPDGPAACQRAVRYARVAFDMGHEWRATEEGDAIRISYGVGVPSRAAEQVACESGLGNWVNCFRQVSRQDMRPRLVRFPHPAPPDDSAHRAFFGAPVEFGTGACDFVFDRAYAERAAMPKADPAMNAFFSKYADEILATHVAAERSVSERTWDYIDRHLADGEPTAEGAAKALATSSRSLRRALKEQGTSFRRLLEDVRRKRAEELLGQPSATVSETAFLLGFGDLTAFSRAFKRWTGTSPRDYRLRSAG